MWSRAREIAAGDLVIIWLTRDSVNPVVVTPGKEFNGKFGVYSHSDLVGIPYGSKVGSRNGKGFIHVLRPTPELWTIALPHRTQILYLADIAYIISYLNIKPGSRVVEAGTGSGSFSHSVARSVGPKGHLYSYEFHEARADRAREEFRDHGLSEIITLTHRNVCKDGFTVVDKADSVFLDLPAPWDAVAHAKRTLRKDRTTRICCFSPCIEQVLRTVAALNDAGFTGITMYETLLRPHEVHSVPSLQPIGEVSDKLKRSETKREYKRRQQIAASQARKEKKRKRSPQESSESKNAGSQVEGPALQVSDDAGPATEAKKMRTEDEDANRGRVGASDAADGDPPMSEITLAPEEYAPLAIAVGKYNMAEDPVQANASTEAVVMQEPPPVYTEPSAAEPSKTIVSKVINEVRGHTSYLTFAILLPTVLPRGNPHLLSDDIPNPNASGSTSANGTDVTVKLEDR